MVMTGIAGSMSDDAQLGDAVIASDIIHYLYRSRAIDNGEGYFSLQLGTHATSIDPRINGLVTKFIDEVTGDDPRWRDLLIPFADSHVLTEAILAQRQRQSPRPQILFGKIASGDITCASGNFKARLTDHSNQEFLAIDTESAGAAFVASEVQIPWFFVRGICHYSHGTETNLDNAASDSSEPVGPWRNHAAELAGRILVALLPYLAHSLRIGMREGISERDTVLQAGEVKAISPLTEERRRVASYAGTFDYSPPAVFDDIQDFCTRIFNGSQAQVLIISVQENVRLTRTSAETVHIETLQRNLESSQLRGELARQQIIWEPDVDQRTNERLQGLVNQAALWLGRVPSELATDKRPPVAVMDEDGNVTVWDRVYLRRSSRILRTDAWRQDTTIGELRVELRGVLGTAQRDILGVLKAVRTSLEVMQQLSSADTEEADPQSG
jgi:nucleoside phosphorylase